MLKLGCHQSISGGYLAMAKEAQWLGSTTLAYFTRNPRGGSVRPLDLQDLEAFVKEADALSLFPLVAHAPYTYNLASDKEQVRSFALQSMMEDLERMEHLPPCYYNFHPGSHVGQGKEKGIELILEALNLVLKRGFKTTLLLEGMAGKGSEIGGSFEDLAMILQGVSDSRYLGVTLDSCHVYDAGYDIKKDLQAVLDQFHQVVGLEKLKALHLNDSKNDFASKKDRHEKIGQGSLGIETFEKIVNHPVLNRLPMILETPNEKEGYKEEISLLRSLVAK